MIMYYDRQGRPLSLEEVAPLLGDFSYKRVAFDVVGDYVVSTVWLGLDHNFGFGGAPLIFETMIFSVGTHIDEYCDRYSTEEEAVEGHKKAVKVARKMVPRNQRWWRKLHRRSLWKHSRWRGR